MVSVYAVFYGNARKVPASPILPRLDGVPAVARSPASMPPAAGVPKGFKLNGCFRGVLVG